ncbi:MAG: ABC transporter substrate-binding protein [Phenylobacterium zucineum]|nr:MAG: ABC transporter substrate-binding protein [Phenylobacterium zucineum]
MAGRAERPGRVVSLNPCLDVMLYALADRAQIAAVSHYSHDISSSSLGNPGLSLPYTYGTAEEVLLLHPDLVLCSPYAAPATMAALRRRGLRLETFGLPDTVRDSRAQVQRLARVIGWPERGEVLCRRIDRALAAAAPELGARPLRALVYQTGGFAVAPGTLMDEMLRRTGFTNAATDYGLTRTGDLPLERLIANPPEVLLAGQLRADAPNWADRLLRHPALARIGPGMFRATLPQRLTYCGGPVLIELAGVLADIYRRAQAFRA